VQMIMEIRDGLIKNYQPFRYIQFLLFFPTISSGPIDRYRRFEKDQCQPPATEKYLTLLEKGIQNIFLGFLYKFIIGYYLGQVLLPIVSKAALQHGGFSWSLVGYTYVYSLYLFFDFAGYSLFAVGTSYLMGYQTPINFNKPFLSWNIKEFWNRWHMTLSFWFRDYVYMRLMFFLMKKKWFKGKIVTSNIGYYALFLLMGIWHGLTWYYIVYGLYHATLICLTDVWLRFKKKHKKQLPSNWFTHAFAVFMTFQAVCFSLLIFSGFLDQLLFK
ncbi:MAG: D-alanyl-lipoteichoic acid biosynthesis protein DltB, partial [Enterococcus hirae]|nr:D-alanyl-lipoteichoic acid biosynthesis protein DltB [Enterococcus hirae]